MKFQIPRLMGFKVAFFRISPIIGKYHNLLIFGNKVKINLNERLNIEINNILSTLYIYEKFYCHVDYCVEKFFLLPPIKSNFQCCSRNY